MVSPVDVTNCSTVGADCLACRKHLYTLPGYHKRTIFSVHWSSDVENCGIIENFFGKDGKACLEHGRFVKFLEDLQEEVCGIQLSDNIIKYTLDHQQDAVSDEVEPFM
ncbi:hypothetical protein POM88_041501 [Heracleum sosnowskyi]|uniref:Uncharacterized protein n=1 Tax=Heracleum sosnowskyi TaxID=360622 RepID=A0AAD8M8D4_9APIA|nr:hypothetical protein POM88_041501 [Heracleum sosnowskyi]